MEIGKRWGDEEIIGAEEEGIFVSVDPWRSRRKMRKSITCFDRNWTLF